MNYTNRLSASALLFLTLTLAANSSQSAEKTSPWRIGIGVGYGERSNPLIQSKDIPIAVDVDLAWFGERFFFDNGDLGLTLSDSSRYTLNVVARVNSDRVFFSKTDRKFVQVGNAVIGQPLEVAPVKPPSRDYAIEAGFELLTDGPWGSLQLAAHHDISSTHDGFEAVLDYGYSIRAGRWYLQPGLGLTYRSAQRNNYYWGVTTAESSVALPAFEVGSGINVHLGLRASYYFNKRLSFVASVNYEVLDSEIQSSPLVVDDDVRGYFAGLFYRF